MPSYICKLKEISRDGSTQKLGKVSVEITKEAVIISGDHNEHIPLEKIKDFADSMSSDGSDNRFESLMFRLDLPTTGGVRKLYFDYTDENYTNSDDAETLFGSFVAPLRKKFLAQIYGKDISELTDYDISKLYGIYHVSKDQRIALYVLICIALIIVGSIFMFRIAWWSIFVVILLAFAAWPASAIAQVSYEVSPQGFRKTNKFGSIFIPWHKIKKLVRKEKQTKHSVFWVHGIYWEHNGREKHYFINEQTLKAQDFQALLTVLRYKLKNVPQLKSRGYSQWTGRVKEYVPWKLDQRS